MGLGDFSDLIRAAIGAREMAYSPYSGFCVGAALLGASGKVYTGCNIENAAYSPTICAERAAVAKAVSEGEREFSAIAVIGGEKAGEPRFCYPCGVCLQTLKEFASPDFKFIIVKNENEYLIHTMEELLPFGFGL